MRTKFTNGDANGNTPQRNGRAARKPNGKGKGGRPPKGKEKYDPKKFPIMALAMCEHIGATDVMLAKAFNVSVQAIDNWKRVHEDFREAVISGKDAFNTMAVEGSLLKRALGYKFTELKSEDLCLPNGTILKAGKRTTTIKEVVPDVGAQVFWLKNRNRGRWKDFRAVQMSDGDGNPLPPLQVNFIMPDNHRGDASKQPKEIDAQFSTVPA